VLTFPLICDESKSLLIQTLVAAAAITTIVEDTASQILVTRAIIGKKMTSDAMIADVTIDAMTATETIEIRPTRRELGT